MNDEPTECLYICEVLEEALINYKHTYEIDPKVIIIPPSVYAELEMEVGKDPVAFNDVKIVIDDEVGSNYILIF
jgi:hypothetical protein